MYMDYFLFTRIDGFNRSVNDPIARKYYAGKRLIENFCYVGLSVLQDIIN